MLHDTMMCFYTDLLEDEVFLRTPQAEFTYPTPINYLVRFSISLDAYYRVFLSKESIYTGTPA